MLEKPEIYIGLDMYGQGTLQAYQWLIEDVDDEITMESLHNLINCVYKDGVKDGIELCRLLDTK